MRKRITVFISVLFAFVLISAVSLYFLAAYRYKSGFTYGTVINGHNCAGLSVAEVNEILLKDTVYTGVTVSSSLKDEVIDLSSIGFKCDYSADLEGLCFDQKPLLWGRFLFYGKDGYRLDPVITFDEEKLFASVKDLSVVKEFDEGHIAEVKIKKGNSGFYLSDTVRKVLDSKRVYDLIYNALKNGETLVTIPDEWIEYPAITTEMERERQLWDEISPFVDREIVYDMGAEKIIFDSGFFSNLLTKTEGDFKRNEDGSLFVDDSMIERIIDAICDRYDTFELPRDFVSVNKENKHVEKSLYGTLIDRAAEKKYLISAVKEGLSETHIPKYLHKAYVRGLDDIGATRIEIDLTRQKLYYILDGIIDMECDVVTGNPKKGHATPEMVCYVKKKTRDTYLKGEDYRSFVNYWMPIYKTTIGIHDATWQKKFGGERYINHGSHGCINMKLEEAEELFDKVSVGVPVLVYK
ncbi:MAG: L,D-transpeptidase [Lachnospiraceae bacterium]|nr:L,D-transpeptidase [Lachnospiraceae bacterium]